MTPEEVLALLTLVARLQSLNVRYEAALASKAEIIAALTARIAELEKPKTTARKR